ncbi:MAG: helix-turn-helix transcriptional regulator [Bacteriovoracaceae bacterium]|jgi:DNA-binding transcriptional ArsR family regulator|nr:helix-turn-helix transcriptional regulator [Bacteriovoracaceae bacterium]
MGKQSEIKKLTENLDAKFFKTLSEPVRVEILKTLLELGESDVNTLSERMPQDRSVISRHLSKMEDASILTMKKCGRNVLYNINGSEFLGRFENILTSIKKCLSFGCCK